jgi:hypothetical protein
MDAGQRERDQRGVAGEIEGRPELEQAAILCGLGLNGWGTLITADPVDQLLFAALAEQVAAYRKDEREALAVAIANAWAKAQR